MPAGTPRGTAPPDRRAAGGRPPVTGPSRSATELAMHFERGRDADPCHPVPAAWPARPPPNGARRAKRSAHLTRALDLLRAQPDYSRASRAGSRPPDRARGSAHGHQGPRRARGRAGLHAGARALSADRRRLPQLFPVFWGLFLFRTEPRRDRSGPRVSATRLLALAQHANDPGLMIEAHHALWSTLFARGELMAARDHVAQAVALYDPDRHASLAAVYGNHDAAVCALGHGAWALELSGEPEQASRQSAGGRGAGADARPSVQRSARPSLRRPSPPVPRRLADHP